jgi:hypothetical protein
MFDFAWTASFFENQASSNRSLLSRTLSLKAGTFYSSTRFTTFLEEMKVYRFSDDWSMQGIHCQGRRNTFEIGGAEFLEAPPWLAPSGKFFEN